MSQGDNLLTLAEGVMPPGAGAAGGSAVAPTGPGLDGREFARRVRQWYLSDIAHPLWQTYSKQADIDEAFYVGGPGQWLDDEGSKDDYEALRRQRRATPSINQIKPIIKVLTGLERQTRFDYKLLPQGEEDEQDARLMTWLYRFVCAAHHVPEIRSQAFKDGALIRGMAVLHCGLTWDEHPVSGDFLIEKLTPGKDCLWDPHWTMPDFSDASHFIRYRWAWIREIKAQYPEYADEIEQAVGDLNAILGDLAQVGGHSRGPGGDAYGGVAEPNIDQLNADRYFYDPQLQRLLVAEAWYQDYESRWYLFHKESGKLEEIPEEVPNPGALARAAQEADPTRVQAIKRVRRYLRTGTVLPAVHVTLEEDETPYSNDRQHYPYVLVLGERTGDDIRGMVRDLRDAQRVENKRIGQALDLVARWGKIRRVAEENSLDPRSEQSLNDPLAEGVIYYRTGKQPPAWDVPAGLGDLTRMLVGLADQMKISIRETSGINADLLGLKDDTSSGIAIARRQAQGQIIATEVFDQNRWAGELFGQRLGRRIQQKFTRDEYVRLTNDIGASVLVRLNPVEVRRVEDKDARRALVKQMRLAAASDPTKPEILANVDKFEWDLVLSEAPASPTARAEALDVLLKMVERVPAVLPILIDKLVQLTDGLPDKPEILGRIKAMQAAQFGPALGGPGSVPAAGVGGIPGTQGETPTTVAPPPAGAALPSPVVA